MALMALGAAGPVRAQNPPPDAPQVHAPIYRSGTYLVPVGISLAYRKKPWTGLTKADVLMVLDKSSIVPLEVQPDDHSPNHYTIFFQPPDSARDGKAHQLQIKVKKPGSNDWTTLPFKMPLTLPNRDGG